MNRLLRIARREYFSYLRTPGFWISLLIGPMVGALGGAAPHWAQQAAPLPRMAVVDLGHTGAGPTIMRALQQGPRPAAVLVPAPADVQQAATPDAAAEALRPYVAGTRRGADGESLDAAAVLTGSPDRITMDFWSRDINDTVLEGLVGDAVSQSMQQARLRAVGLDPNLIAGLQSARPDVRTFSPRASAGRVSLRDKLPSLIGLALAFVLFFSIFTGAGILLNSVIEEKSTRVLEVLLSSASVPEILGGKILGAAGLSATVIVGWATVAGLAVERYWPGVSGQILAALFAHGLVVWFALFFAAGYLMYASVFAAIGSFCETVREAQTLLGPLMIIITIPVMFLSLAMEHPDAPLIAGLSWIPLFTPFLMTARLASDPPLWQVLGALAVMTATTTLVVWGCAAAFRAGALSSGRFELKRLLPWRRAVRARHASA